MLYHLLQDYLLGERACGGDNYQDDAVGVSHIGRQDVADDLGVFGGLVVGFAGLKARQIDQGERVGRVTGQLQAQHISGELLAGLGKAHILLRGVDDRLDVPAVEPVDRDDLCWF